MSLGEFDGLFQVRFLSFNPLKPRLVHYFIGHAHLLVQ
ncbi:hypothetical protein LpnH3D14_01766 [Legionella pneumophila]|nr:hypothetical protein [Legionella pneumophila]WBA05954.1 hypothetical protein LpnH3D14_01763 [Legionella pneumophila]WBA05957.1 hypothetical protein LpnH3D14_01766 [Legionella pneumophila]CZJ24324.1 Uncharacterised protein [Legionella pneumophila]